MTQSNSTEIQPPPLANPSVPQSKTKSCLVEDSPLSTSPSAKHRFIKSKPVCPPKPRTRLRSSSVPASVVLKSYESSSPTEGSSREKDESPSPPSTPVPAPRKSVLTSSVSLTLFNDDPDSEQPTTNDTTAEHSISTSLDSSSTLSAAFVLPRQTSVGPSSRYSRYKLRRPSEPPPLPPNYPQSIRRRTLTPSRPPPPVPRSKLVTALPPIPQPEPVTAPANPNNSKDGESEDDGIYTAIQDSDNEEVESSAPDTITLTPPHQTESPEASDVVVPDIQVLPPTPGRISRLSCVRGEFRQF